MKHKNAFCVSATLAVCMAAAPMIAQGAQQDSGQQSPLPTKSQSPLLKVQPPPPYMDLNGKDALRTIPGAYRLTYTLTEMDGSKRVGSQKYQIVLDADAPPAHLDTQATVRPGSNGGAFSIDLGVRIFARLRQFANGTELNTEIQDSSLVQESDHQTASMTMPAVRKSHLNTTVLLHENKPVTIGNLDMPGSEHSLQVQVELTRVP